MKVRFNSGLVVSGNVVVSEGDVMEIDDAQAAHLVRSGRCSVVVSKQETGGGGTGIETAVDETSTPTVPIVGRGRPRMSKTA